MRRASCIIQGIVIMIVLFAVGYGLSQCATAKSPTGMTERSQSSVRDTIRGLLTGKKAEPIVDPQPQEPAEPQTKAGDEPVVSMTGRLLAFIDGLLGRDTGATPEPAAPASRKIEGLILRSKRSLVLTEVRIEGLAATESSLYVSALVPPHDTPMLYRIDQTLFKPMALRELPGGDGARPGALSMGEGSLWLTLRMPDVDDETVILQIDPETLAVTKQFSVPVSTRAVAQVGDALIGFDDAGDRSYRWTLDGELDVDTDMAQHARYSSIEAIGSSLVCTGIDLATQGGVIDIVDASSLSIIRRHKGEAISADGAPLLAQPCAVHMGRFQLLASQGENPLVATYQLNEVTLEQYVPQAGAE